MAAGIASVVEGTLTGLGLDSAVRVISSVMNFLKPITTVIEKILKMITMLLTPIMEVVIVLLMPFLMMLKPMVKMFNQFMKPFRELAMSAMKMGMTSFKAGDKPGGMSFLMLAVIDLLTGLGAFIMAAFQQSISSIVTVFGMLFGMFIGAIFPGAEEKVNAFFEGINVLLSEGFAKVMLLMVNGLASMNSMTGANLDKFTEDAAKAIDSMLFKTGKKEGEKGLVPDAVELSKNESKLQNSLLALEEEKDTSLILQKINEFQTKGIKTVEGIINRAHEEANAIVTQARMDAQLISIGAKATVRRRS